MSSTKLPISALPLPASNHILTHNLTPDPATPSARTHRDVLQKNPSVQRRSRLVNPAAHFSHVTPLPIEFPYRISPPEDEQVPDKALYVEQWLAAREALAEQQLVPVPNQGALRKYSSDKRNTSRALIGLSETGLKDCLPQLDVGDAFAQIGSPKLAHSEEVDTVRPSSDKDAAVRAELVDVLSGQSALMGTGEEQAYAPWSLRYSGHQFGNWAGQLGDGRAISILEVPHPTQPGLQFEVQLKGAGRTPYSRSADGLAVLRSSIREYLCAEAMHALHIPTTRSLALIHLPDLQVVREEVETACILTRLAPSFIRIGSFEAFNPPRNMFFLGGGQQDADFDGLRLLGEWVSTRVLRLDVPEGKPWGKALVMEVARRNAQMVAGWQAYGFMHGVMNTDNISIMGLTIDYGPYAFMDIWDPSHICNHTDEEGRYAYKFQTTMIIYALRALLSSLAELIGAETDLGKAVQAGWAENVSKDKLAVWRKTGMELETEVKAEIERVFATHYWALMRKRLGLKTTEANDEDKLIHPLLDLMQRHKLDFHSTFRHLTYFRPSLLDADTDAEALQNHVTALVGSNADTDRAQAAKDWLSWLDIFASRVSREASVWEGGDAERGEAARNANPRFVLRQWVLEEIIRRVQTDAKSGARALAKLHDMATRPYEGWGAEGDARPESELSAEEKEERRFCGLGAKRFLGFQCSCSS